MANNFNKNPYEAIVNDLDAVHNAEYSVATAPPPQYSQQPVQPQPMSMPTSTASASAPINIMTGFPPMTNGNPPVGPHSTELTCPQCRSRVKTKVRHRSTAKTHIACLLLSWTCCCCCLPYCMDSCRNANHFCPFCGAFVGTYQS